MKRNFNSISEVDSKSIKVRSKQEIIDKILEYEKIYSDEDVKREEFERKGEYALMNACNQYQIAIRSKVRVLDWVINIQE